MLGESIKLTHRTGARQLVVSGALHPLSASNSRCAPPNGAVNLSGPASWLILGASEDTTVALVKPHLTEELYVVGDLFETVVRTSI